MEKIVRDWNWILGVGAWLIAAVICAFALAYAFDLSIPRTFAGVVGVRLLVNLVLIGGKDLYEGANGGGSRTI